MNQLILSIIFLYFFSFSFSQQVGQIGSGTRNIVATPAYGLYDFTQSGMIYLASELESIGISPGNSITAIEFEFEGWSTNYELNDQLIKISHIEESSFNSTEYPDYRSLNTSNTITVKNTFDWRAPANEDWEVFNFDTPFVWNGVDNILISWENRDGTYTFGYGWLNGRSDTYGRAHTWRKDDTYPTASSASNTFLPNIKIHTNFNPLPITLNSFSGKLLSGLGNSIQLDWSTASEKDNNYFTLWRSFDGQTWEDITQLTGAGNSHELLNYQYIDRNIILESIENNTIYYKLSQTDYDGTTEFFQIISVEIQEAKTHVVRRTNLMGQEVDQNHKGLVLETWNNGAVHKTVHK